MTAFYPLHVHSYYSLLRGAASVESLVDQVASHGINALAITDFDSMQGLIPLIKAAKLAGIKPILGSKLVFDNNQYIICLARNNLGYSEICKLITQKKLLEEFSIQSVLTTPSENIIYITDSSTIVEEYRTMRNLFLSVHSEKDFSRKPPHLVHRMIFNPPVFFLYEEDHILHRILSAIRVKKTIETTPALEVVGRECSLEELIQIDCTNIPEVLLANNRYIMENCNANLPIGEYKFPVFPTPKSESNFEFLYRICIEGLEQRYPEPASKIYDRLLYELEVIAELHFVDYFLVVWDIVKEAKRRGMMMIGRGSAANSLVSYCLGFTEVDPIHYNLYFERFLNRSRTSPPDVDLDFSWKERDEIVKYVFEKYGYERVAMISTTITFRARSAFRETAKVFGYSENQIGQYAKFIPWTSAKNLERITELFPEARHLTFEDDKIKQVLHYAAKLAGFPRHLSIHPSGIVVTPEPITNYTALEYAKNKGLGIIVTQPDMYTIEEIGLVKIDLLSQRSLGVLRNTLKQLEND